MVELSGESEELAIAEAMAVSRIHDSSAQIVESDMRALVIEGEFEPHVLQRLGLAWSWSQHMFSCHGEELPGLLEGLELPRETFRVNTRRMGTQDSQEAVSLAKQVGALISENYKVDLDNPEVEVRILKGRRLHLGLLKGEIDRPSFEARKSENRPFSHPISLHPRLARALVNLTGIKEGHTLLDPFCGTGGILLEAGLIGCNVLGGDIDQRMIDGTRLNLNHYNIEPDLRLQDISCWRDHSCQVDAIATDPPYGRSATTAKEPIDSLYKRAFEVCREALKPGGRLAIVLPEEGYADNSIMEREFMVPVRVHKSLTRYFCLFRN